MACCYLANYTYTKDVTVVLYFAQPSWELSAVTGALGWLLIN